MSYPRGDHHPGQRERPAQPIHGPYGGAVQVKAGERVKQGDVVFEWEPFAEPILTDATGVVRSPTSNER